MTKTIDVFSEFRLPWATFPQEVFDVLNNTVVSFKTITRVINKSSNKYECFVDGKKEMVAQTKGDMFVPRKPLHKSTVYGRVNLKRIKEMSLKEALKTPKMIVDNTIKSVVMDLIKQGYDNKKILKYLTETQSSLCSGKIKVYYFSEGTKEPMVAERKEMVSYFNGEANPEKIHKKIDAITDTGIQTILRNHLAMEEDAQLAFSPEGIDRMNENIIMLNGGKFHHPIRRVRVSERLGLKTPIGDFGQKATKYVEAEKGTNLFCGIYINEEGKRSYETISYRNAVALQEQGLPPVADRNAKGDRLLFVLSVNDLVYVPTSEELESRSISQPIDISRIYKTVSFTDNEIYFIQHHVAKPIIDKVEFSKQNKMQKAVFGEKMIKEICVPVRVDSLGRIKVMPKF